jgi:hypothetical protein
MRRAQFCPLIHNTIGKYRPCGLTPWRKRRYVTRFSTVDSENVFFVNVQGRSLFALLVFTPLL